MKRIMVRILCLLLVCTMLFSLCACGKDESASGGIQETNTSEGQAENNSQILEVDLGSLSYEQEYIDQHLAYVDRGEYKTILANKGGLAGALKTSYEDAWLNHANRTWHQISEAITTIAGANVKLDNKYQLIVAELMQSTGAEDNFSGSFEKNYLDSYSTLLFNLHGFLKDTNHLKKVLTGEDALKQAENLGVKLDAFIVLIQDLQKKPGSKEHSASLFSDILGDVKKEVSSCSLLQNNKEFLNSFGSYMGIGLDIMDVVSNTMTDMMDQYAFVQAVSGASEQWLETWEAIAEHAELQKKDGEKIAEAIRYYLSETRLYLKDHMDALMAMGGVAATTNLGEFTLASGINVFHELVKQTPLGMAVKDGLLSGVAVSNCLVNADDLAYFGEMLVGYGILGDSADTVMRRAEIGLRNDESYEDALMFDQIFHIYKAIQMSAADCAIKYCQQIVEAPVGHMFPRQNTDQIAETVMLQAYKADWMPRECHSVAHVINNGGKVLGFKNNLYYFRPRPDSVATTGTLGYFGPSNKVPSDLVVRNGKGEESILFSACAYPNLYIAEDHIFYKNVDGNWYRHPLNATEEPPVSLGKVNVLGVLPGSYQLIVQSSSGIYTNPIMGQGEALFPEGCRDIILTEDACYSYQANENGSYQFFRYGLEDRKLTALGNYQLNAPGSNMWGSISKMYVEEDGLYMVAGFYAGTGMFFQEGDLLFLNFETGQVEVLADGLLTNEMIYIAHEGEGENLKRYVYYNTGSQISNKGLYDAGIGENICRMDLDTRNTENVDFVLCEEGVPYIRDGGIRILWNRKPEPDTLFPKSTAESFGYNQFGIQDNGNALYCTDVDVVNDIIYLTIYDVEPDNSSSIGSMQQGYRRRSAKMYALNLEEGKAEMLFRY